MPDGDQHTDIRDIVVSFRLTPTEATHLDAVGAALNPPRTRNDFARAAALAAARRKAPPQVKAVRYPPRRKPSADIEALARILGQLGRVGGNVNQLARLANRSGGLPILERLRPIAIDVAEARAAIQTALEGRL